MISERYLLVLNIALHAHDGRYWAEPLWHKDLMLHLREIERLELLCPVRGAPPPAGWLPCDDPRLRIVPVPPLGPLAPLRLPSLALSMWRAVGRSDIVHTGVAGWPFPLGWIAAPIARLRGRFLLVVVESSFWRAGPGASQLKRWKAGAIERINRAVVNACDLSVFTTEAYRRDLATHPRGPALLAPASWLDEDQLLAPEQVPQACEPRLLYAGRLTEAKGVQVLLDALRRSDAAVDIVGTGDLAEACATLAAEQPGRVRMIEPVAYGPAFSALLDRYRGLIVPSLSDEQPRVIFDAFARGLPVVASDTPGHIALVRNGETGWLARAGDADALAAAMDRAVSDPAESRALGLAALESVRDRTHAAMHRDRADAISRAYSERSSG